MKGKKFLISALLIFLMLPISNTLAFEFKDKVNGGISVFFLVDLDVGENIVLSVSHEGDGNFMLFFFDTRPFESHVNLDKTLNPTIFDMSIAYDLSENPALNFTASQHQIYYMQIILLETDSDTFTLSSTKDLTRYYLPQIPGFQLEFIAISLLLSSIIVMVVIKKKIHSQKGI
jgi:hypothetical protein